ncbi:MAG: glutamate 5-kinase [Alphaproteobacteria bacterium]|nr:glutamate 5-kinase [Alphaproteobacteria bacterium]
MQTLDVLKAARSVVIKIGTALIAREDADGVRTEWLTALAQDVAALRKQGKNVTIISSGGIALGRSALGISPQTPPQKIPLEHKQAASSVGQFRVFHGYHEAFSAQELTCAQILLTMTETENRAMHLNARATLQTLLDKGIVPIINENDTVSTAEIRFGDNDRLAARVAQMINADVVVLLSTIDGLYTANPYKNPGAQHIPIVETLGDEHVSMAGDALPGLSTGGMKSKIEAAQTALRAGIPLLIADGRAEHALDNIFNNAEMRCTLFMASAHEKNARKSWIHAHLKPKGAVYVDSGALQALKNGKSLLPVGVKKVEGVFARGDAVEIRALEDGQRLGIGLSAYSSKDAGDIMGKKSADILEILGYAGRDELIHRNDMVLEV